MYTAVPITIRGDESYLPPGYDTGRHFSQVSVRAPLPVMDQSLHFHRCDNRVCLDKTSDEVVETTSRSVRQIAERYDSFKQNSHRSMSLSSSASRKQEKLDRISELTNKCCDELNELLQMSKKSRYKQAKSASKSPSPGGSMHSYRSEKKLLIKATNPNKSYIIVRPESPQVNFNIRLLNTAEARSKLSRRREETGSEFIYGQSYANDDSFHHRSNSVTSLPGCRIRSSNMDLYDDQGNLCKSYDDNRRSGCESPFTYIETMAIQKPIKPRYRSAAAVDEHQMRSVSGSHRSCEHHRQQYEHSRRHHHRHQHRNYHSLNPTRAPTPTRLYQKNARICCNNSSTENCYASQPPSPRPRTPQNKTVYITKITSPSPPTTLIRVPSKSHSPHRSHQSLKQQGFLTDRCWHQKVIEIRHLQF